MGRPSAPSRIRFTLIALPVISLLFAVLWAWIPDDFGGTPCAVQRNAAWISVDWASKPSTDSSVRALGERAASHQLQDLYSYTTYLRADGTFSPSYDHAAEFLWHFRQVNQSTRLLAWIGVPLKNEGRFGIRGWVDLADERIRGAIVNFIGALLSQVPFDGVHLDVETVRGDDSNFLQLLQAVKAILGPKRVLSVSGGHWAPDVLDRLPVVGDLFWTDHYYRAVAQRADQIASMTYDSSLPQPGLYRLWMREQVRGITHALADTNADLLIGISVSREDTATHHADAENLRNGLIGLCAGLDRSAPVKQVSGIAIYADWEFSGEDEQVWQDWQK